MVYGFFELSLGLAKLVSIRVTAVFACPPIMEREIILNKTIVCIDCGKEVVVDGIVKNKKRCDECQKKYIRKLKTEKQREYRKRE